MGVAKGFSILLPTDTIPHLPRYDAKVGFSILLPTDTIPHLPRYSMIL